MNTIYIFREQRCGGTALSHKLSDHLSEKEGKKLIGVSNKKDLDNAFLKYGNNIILDTHVFNLLEHVSAHDEVPMLIRLLRKDLAEQCLSNLITLYINEYTSENNRFFNLKRDEQLNVNVSLFEHIKPTIFTKTEVYRFLNLRKRNEDYWNTYASKFNNVTLYYENLCNKGEDIPFLDLYDVKINDESYTVKLPDYKNRLCLNSDMIRKWIQEFN